MESFEEAFGAWTLMGHPLGVTYPRTPKAPMAPMVAHGTPTWQGRYGAHGTPTSIDGTPTWQGHPFRQDAHGTPTLHRPWDTHLGCSWDTHVYRWDTHLAGTPVLPVQSTGSKAPMGHPLCIAHGTPPWGRMPMGHPLGVLMGHPRLSMGHPLGRDTRFASPVHRVDVDSRLSDDSPLAYHRCRFKAFAGGMPLEFRQSAGHGGKLCTVHGAGGVDFVSPDPGSDPNP